MTYEVSDELGNKFYTKNYVLALKITKDNNNPFINLHKTNEKIDDEHIINTMEEFEEYFF